MSGSVTFLPLESDFTAVARGSFLRALRRRRFAVRCCSFALFGVLVGTAAGWATDHSLSMAWALFGLITAAGWFATIIGATFLLLPRRTRRLFRQQRTLRQEFTFAWNDVGIVFASANSRSDLAWRDYHDWFETGAVFGFGLNEQLYHWAPKRALSCAQADDLRATAQAAFDGLRQIAAAGDRP